MNQIWVVHEIEGGSILEAFECEADAKSYLHWEAFEGRIDPRWYKITQTKFTKEKK